MASNGPYPDYTSLEQTHHTASRPASDNEDEDVLRTPGALESTSECEEEVCMDCEKKHIPRRLVICHDGTWMLPDGAIGKSTMDTR